MPTYNLPFPRESRLHTVLVIISFSWGDRRCQYVKMWLQSYESSYDCATALQEICERTPGSETCILYTFYNCQAHEMVDWLELSKLAPHPRRCVCRSSSGEGPSLLRPRAPQTALVSICSRVCCECRLHQRLTSDIVFLEQSVQGHYFCRVTKRAQIV